MQFLCVIISYYNDIIRQININGNVFINRYKIKIDIEFKDFN